MFESYTFALLWDWAEFAARWLHVITAIAWIGSSFYFIALDLGLRRRDGLPEGVAGEEWQVHGGGFYHIQKYVVAPDHLPDHLTWFKWESYATWLSGFAMMVLVYYMGADLYLVDAARLDLPVWLAIGLSVASMVGGWFAYDRVCRTRFGDDNLRLMLFLFAVLVALSWVFAQIFTGRAALLHLGAVTGTLMAGNVFLTIIPNQKIVVADLKAGRVPDPVYGKIAKQRSVHNNYLTLPVLFLMLSIHYPLAFASQWNWLIGALVFLMGVTIRHYFNTRHARAGNPLWAWALTVAIFLVIVWLSALPGREPAAAAAEEAALRGPARAYAAAEGFEDVYYTVLGRCSMCHARAPSWDGMHWAPKAVHLETEADVARHARQIYLQAGASHAMPPGNVSYMTEQERAAIVAWYRAARG
ncbi:putative membrane protein [Rhodovulum iodosum]|uniref:Membrane protein n=1 Tax=Rhodovulum iodosum TaxID=68291 RepID=A0ABV3XQ00_9RHOB|nr:urate hydroxylase PuuD [Rhodovulum robiginosum]RSK31341.1 cysteine desulfurase [Rhodovulum robiginosum]